MQVPSLHRSLVAAGMAAIGTFGAAHGEPMLPAAAAPSPTVSSGIVAVVAVPRPWYAPAFVVVSKMRETIPQYERLPGLVDKVFTLSREGRRFGGIYLWTDRAAAETWFDAAWFARVERERGVQGEVRYFDAPVVLDNTGGAPPGDDASVATIVTLPTPAGVTRERLVAEFDAAVPTDRRIDGLLRKYFIVTGDGRFGGVYVWRSQIDADRWFDTAWHERVRRTDGTDASLAWFDAPILLRSEAAVAATRP